MSSNKRGTLDPEEQQRAHRKRHGARRAFGEPIRFKFSVSKKTKGQGKRKKRKEERYFVERANPVIWLEQAGGVLLYIGGFFISPFPFSSILCIFFWGAPTHRNGRNGFQTPAPSTCHVPVPARQVRGRREGGERLMSSSSHILYGVGVVERTGFWICCHAACFALASRMSGRNPLTGPARHGTSEKPPWRPVQGV